MVGERRADKSCFSINHGDGRQMGRKEVTRTLDQQSGLGVSGSSHATTSASSRPSPHAVHEARVRGAPGVAGGLGGTSLRPAMNNPPLVRLVKCEGRPISHRGPENRHAGRNSHRVRDKRCWWRRCLLDYPLPPSSVAELCCPSSEKPRDAFPRLAKTRPGRQDPG